MPPKPPPNVDSDIDALFQRPLAEFTAGRNELGARLKREGRRLEAERVKALVKPSAPAWAVNQLFWEEPKAFERLFAVTERVRKAQTGATKNADLAGLLAEKKKATSALMARAVALLAAAGHAASADAMRRISATLEALAVLGHAEGAPQAGRLTADLDPPGFDALAAVMGGQKIEASKVLLFRRPSKPVEDPAAAKARVRAAVKEAENGLREARRRAERAEAALERANARAAAAAKEKAEIEARFAEAREAASAAASEAKQAAQALAEADRAVARARGELG